MSVLSPPRSQASDSKRPDTAPIWELPAEEQWARWQAALEAFWEEAGTLPPGWDQRFDADLRRHRLTFPERS